MKKIKQKIYEDNRLVYKLTLLIKIPQAMKNLTYVQNKMG